MAEAQFRVVHYVNQFFGQIGGEEKADIPPLSRDGAVGPAVGLNAAMGGKGVVVGTVICGDTYFNEHLDEAARQVGDMISAYAPDVVVVGPAFNAGRYGVACGAVAQVVSETLGVPVVGGMYEENPGVEMYARYGYFLRTRDNAAGMRQALPAIAKLATRLGLGQEIGSPEEEGYFPRGVRKNYFAGERGSARAVNMLIKKLKGEQFETEYPMPVFDRVDPNPAVGDMRNAVIALVTSGGIVPKGNPDKIESSSASKYGKYDLEKVDALSEETHETAHGGYDPVYANADPNRVLPVDAMRELEREGRIKRLHRHFYSTVGNGTSVANAKKYATQIAQELRNDGVTAVTLTST